MYLEEISYFMFKTVIFSVNFIFERNTLELRTVQHVISEEKTSIVQHIQYNNNAGHAPSQLNCGYDKFMAFKLAFVNVKCVLLRRRALSDQCRRRGGMRRRRQQQGGLLLLHQGSEKCSTIIFHVSQQHTVAQRRRTSYTLLCGLLTAVSLHVHIVLEV